MKWSSKSFSNPNHSMTPIPCQHRAVTAALGTPGPRVTWSLICEANCKHSSAEIELSSAPEKHQLSADICSARECSVHTFWVFCKRNGSCCVPAVGIPNRSIFSTVSLQFCWFKIKTVFALIMQFPSSALMNCRSRLLSSNSGFFLLFFFYFFPEKSRKFAILQSKMNEFAI